MVNIHTVMPLVPKLVVVVSWSPWAQYDVGRRRRLVARCVRTKTRSLGRLKPVELQGKHKERKKMHKIKKM